MTKAELEGFAAVSGAEVTRIWNDGRGTIIDHIEIMNNVDDGIARFAAVFGGVALLQVFAIAVTVGVARSAPGAARVSA